jgi:uncharacterized membrane protein SirB2
VLALNPVNAYSSAFPVLECIHIVGIVCGVGTAALVNLRLLGVGLTQKSAARLWSDATPWTLGGLTVAIFSGLLLFSMDPEMYYTGTLFRFKMSVLLLAIVFYFTMVRKAAATETAGRSIIAYTSLALWTLVPCCGIFLGFVGSMEHTYPILLSVHIVSLVLLGGMVVLTDLRWLGVGMRSYSASDLMDGLRVPKRIAFGVAGTGGALLFAANAGPYASNPWLWLKLGLLVLIAVNYLVFRRGAREPGQAKLAAAVSLFLSVSVVAAARGPATVKDVMHSMVDPSGDFLFQSVQTIADEQGVREIAPHTDAQWADVRDRLMILQEAPGLLEGRRSARIRDRSKNPQVESQPEDIQKLLDADPSAFLRRARKLQDAASVALKAVDAKDKDSLLHSLEGIDKACESCHLHYWYPNDKRAQEAAKADGIVE